MGDDNYHIHWMLDRMYSFLNTEMINKTENFVCSQDITIIAHSIAVEKIRHKLGIIYGGKNE